MDIFLGSLAGLLIGAGTVYIWSQSQLSDKRQRLSALEAQYASEQKSAEEKLALLEQARDQLKESFQALSSEALSKNNESFLNLAKTTLEKYQDGAKSDLDKRQEAINKTVEPVEDFQRARRKNRRSPHADRCFAQAAAPTTS